MTAVADMSRARTYSEGPKGVGVASFGQFRPGSGCARRDRLWPHSEDAKVGLVRR